MEQYKNLDIVEVPIGSPHFHSKVERFLGANGLRMEALDAYFAVQDADGNILAGAGIQGDIIKCVAVSSDMRSEGLLTPLISRIVSTHGNLKVFTKPEYRSLFESLGFKLLAQAPLAVLMENGRGLQKYSEYLGSIAPAAEENYFSVRCPKNQFPSASTTPLRTGVIVMNANPFTLGHKYLIDKALERVDRLIVIPVKEDVSMFPYSERLEMINSSTSSSGLSRRSQVMVVEGSDYSISAATFPTYFLKDLTDASETQMRLDLDLFCKHITPALGATVRFAGTEPADPLTRQYNKLMAEVLPQHGIDFVEVPRLIETPSTEAEGDDCGVATPQPSCTVTTQPSCTVTTQPSSSGLSRRYHVISASSVRNALAQGDYRAAARMCPDSTWPYLLAAMAERALRIELDTPMKPGLVCPESNGSHKDMDYGTMLKGIAAIRPFFPKMAVAGTPEELKQLGIDAESAMMAATGGVNTHRGAIFALGLALNAVFSTKDREMQLTDTQQVIQNACRKNAASILRNSLIDNDFHFTPIGAKRMAIEGYRQLFEDWLPFYRGLPVSAGNDERVQKLLLHIMATLDDTCVIKRVGEKRAEALRNEISGTSPKMTGVMTSPKMTECGEPAKDEWLLDLCSRFKEEGISPGGAADMVALTIFFDSMVEGVTGTENCATRGT